MLQPSSAESLTESEGGERSAPLQHPAGTVLAVGIDHSAAPLAIRERVALVEEQLVDACRSVHAHPAVAEVAILSTCNRTELYLVTSEPDRVADLARAHFVETDPAVRRHLREWRGMVAAEHLFRVSAGLESRVLGENQILSQVREALSHAERASTVGPYLHQLFRAGISCGREVRRATGLGRIDSSVTAETIRTAEILCGPLSSRAAIVIGGGTVSRLVAAELRRRGICELYVANRTPSVAQDLAQRLGAVAVPLADVARYLPRADIVVSATSAPRRILTADDVAALQLTVRRDPLHVFDLAVPRDIDPAIGRLPGVVLHDLDSLTPARAWEQRVEDVRSAELIVGGHLRQFERWYRVRRTAPLITELRRQLNDAAATELHRSSRQLARLSRDERDAVERLAGRLTDVIFHRYVSRLRRAAEVDDEALAQAAAFYFGGDEARREEPVPVGVRGRERQEGIGGVR